ncbi:MAG: hypothetical protein KBA75_05435 [Alphaproteobacteria bacterium]|nr:hypothetical protein [Alphaproteobacteria bacterium]
MALKIETFSNQSGGNAFYKAVGHPLAAAKARSLVAHLQANGPVAIYDPNNQLAGFAEFYPLNDLTIGGVYVQDVEQIGRPFLNHRAQPVTALAASKCRSILIASFDSARIVDQTKHLFPANTPWYSFDGLRLPDAMLSDKQRYLSTLNFATNLAFFRDADGQHTRIVTANYWATYGGKEVSAWCNLFDSAGKTIATWTQPLPGANATVVIDSAEVRTRFNLPEFTGQLYIHIIGAAGHDIVKYALDTYGDDDSVLSCTHDANSWPSDIYAGLPAPAADEDVVLWVQNSHPGTIPAGEIGLNLMGDSKVTWLDSALPPFATHKLSVASLLPQARWPQQLEIQAGKHIVRPRYEVFVKGGRSRISHPNVERSDLKADKRLVELGDLLGKLHILPAPILPLERYDNLALPTPMSTAQQHLPLAAIAYDSMGLEVARHAFGNLPRNHTALLDINKLLLGQKLAGGYGHLELVYDFAAGSDVDGWMHSLFRYRDRQTDHVAETSFGSHIFNTLMTYRGEPQSYAGKAPGLSTRLFLRCGSGAQDTLCHLMYPASVPWHSTSDTSLTLTDRTGKEVAKRVIRIPCHGSLLWRVSTMFTPDERIAAGDHAYVLVRDTTCRLFGYHGLVAPNDTAFSLDHMFGF